jgi:hypothetical protein
VYVRKLSQNTRAAHCKYIQESNQHQPSKPFLWIFTHVSKSRSYNVSPNGTFTGFHILVEAASVGCTGTPIIPVADAKAAAATVDPV